MAQHLPIQDSSSEYRDPFSTDLHRDNDLKLSNQSFKTLLVEEAQQKKLPKVQRLKQDPFPNYYLLAYFSSAVYSCDDKKVKLDLPENWNLLTTARNDDSLNRYVGAAFFNPVTQQIIIAHRGTRISDFGSLWSDIIGIWAHYKVAQMSSAATFVDILRKTVKEIEKDSEIRYHISLTGHSLGGWLAQITTFTSEYLKLGETYFFKCIDKTINCHAHTVVFDSPGCEEMLIKLKKSYDLRYHSLLSLDQLDITVFLSSPNRINTCNHHVGTLYRLSADCSSMSFLQKNTFIYTIVTHNMTKLLSLFDQDGKVINGEVFEIVDWPVSGVLFNKEYKAFFKYGDASNNFHLAGDEKLIEDETGRFFSGIRYQGTEVKKDKCSIRIFTQEELWLLECWNSLKKSGVRLNKINDFFNSIHYMDGFLPSFEIDFKTHKICCSTEFDLEKIIRNCKQLNRWYPEETTNSLKAQLDDASISFDVVLYMNTENYLKSLKHTELKFVDNLLIRQFLESDQLVLNIITNQLSSDIENTRIHKILTELEIHRDQLLNPFVQKQHHVFVSWKYLCALQKVFDIHYIFNDNCKLNLIIINFCHNLELRSEAEKNFLENILNVIKGSYKRTSKKFIFLTHDCCDRKEVLSENSTSFIKRFDAKMMAVTKTGDLTFTDLQNDSQIFILNNIVIKLQNGELSLANILNLENTAISCEFENNLGSLIDSKVINSFTLGTKRVEIGHRVPKLCDCEVSKLIFDKEIAEEDLKKLMLTKNIGDNVMFFVTYTRDRFQLDEIDKWHPSYKVERTLVENSDEGLEIFNQLCSKNPEMQIYWVEVDHESVILKQLYNSTFYIHRKFISFKYKLKMQKSVDIESSDLFVFSNVTKQQEQSFIGTLLRYTSLVKENIEVVDSEESALDKLEKESQGTRPVHWFTVKNEASCIWIRSKGSLDNLQKNVVSYQERTLDEKEFDRKIHDTWIIADEPGTGKSTTLTNMFDGLENAWVLRINLKDIEYRSEFDRIPSFDDVVTFLLDKSKNSEFDRLTQSLLTYLLQNKSTISVCVLFDGFDEIRGTCRRETVKLQNYVISLLKFLQNKCEASIWITTRNEWKEMLENSLSVFAIKFYKIKMAERERYLKTVWKYRLSCDFNKFKIEFSTIENHLDSYIKELFSKAEAVFGKEISTFIGIPLQMRMLSELAVPNIELFKQTSDFRVEIPNNALEFFRAFIQYKYGIYFKKTQLSLNLNGITANWFQEDILASKHQDLAFEKVFPDENKKYVKFNFDDLIELNSVGLIRLNNAYSDFDFIDRNIAYYFIAIKIVNLMKTKDQKYFGEKYPSLEYFLLTEIFINSEFRTVRLFIDNYFSEMSLLIGFIEGNKMQFYGRRFVDFLAKNTTMKQLCDEKKQTAFHILVNEQYTYILKFLLDSIKENEDIKKDTLLFLVKHDKYHQTALRLALRNKCFASTKHFIDFISTCNTDFQEQILVSTIFVRYNDRSSEEIEFLSEFLKKYSSLNAILNDIKTKYDLILKIHEASKNGDKNEIENILQSVSDNFKFYLLRTVDQIGDTPISLAVRHKRKELVRYFLTFAGDLDTEDHHGMTLVARAAQNGDLETVRLLVSKGCDFLRPDRRSLNPLLHAAKRDHLDVVQYFIETLGVDINYKDEYGNSAIWLAAKWGKGKIAKYLIKKKCDVDSENVHGMRPLHIAIKSQNWDIVKRLVDAKADINIPDGFGLTPIARVRKTGNLRMITFFEQAVAARS